MASIFGGLFGGDGVQTIKKTVPARIDKKMGMGVIHSKGAVYVSSIIPGSLAADHFLMRDKIVSINGVPVKDKKQCKELILSASTESDFDVVIERLSSPAAAQAKLPEMPQAEAEPMPDMQFMPDVPHKGTGSTEKPKKQQKTRSGPAPSNPLSMAYNGFCLGENDFDVGNPLDGVQLPAPADVRQILRQDMPQILADFMNVTADEERSTKSAVSSKSAKSSKSARVGDRAVPPSSVSLRFEDRSISVEVIATDVANNKHLMKPKKH